MVNIFIWFFLGVTAFHSVSWYSHASEEIELMTLDSSSWSNVKVLKESFQKGKITQICDDFPGPESAKKIVDKFEETERDFLWRYAQNAMPKSWDSIDLGQLRISWKALYILHTYGSTRGQGHLFTCLNDLHAYLRMPVSHTFHQVELILKLYKWFATDSISAQKPAWMTNTTKEYTLNNSANQCLEAANCLVQKDQYGAAEKICLMLTESCNHVEAQIHLGDYYVFTGYPEASLNYYNAAATVDNIDGILSLATYYYLGDDTKYTDYLTNSAITDHPQKCLINGMAMMLNHQQEGVQELQRAGQKYSEWIASGQASIKDCVYRAFTGCLLGNIDESNGSCLDIMKKIEGLDSWHKNTYKLILVYVLNAGKQFYQSHTNLSQQPKGRNSMGIPGFLARKSQSRLLQEVKSWSQKLSQNADKQMNLLTPFGFYSLSGLANADTGTLIQQMNNHYKIYGKTRP